MKSVWTQKIRLRHEVPEFKLRTDGTSLYPGPGRFAIVGRAPLNFTPYRTWPDPSKSPHAQGWSPDRV